jgi:DNA-binding GntR family transcriptional regulator
MLLRDLAYQRFKESLYLERLKPGQFVSQRQLSELLDVPLGPIREALQRISEAGFVNIIDKRGIQIIQETPTSLRETYELRIILELAAIRKGIPAEIISQIQQSQKSAEKMLKRMKDPLSKEAAFKYLEIGWELDELIVGAMENKLIYETFKLTLDKIKVARLREKSTIEQFEAVQIEHQEIIEALREGNKELAAELMENHLKKVLKRGLGIIED